MPARMSRGVDNRRPREASSDASLWDEVDDEAISPFANIVTPPLRKPQALPTPGSNEQQNTASNPITIIDSTGESSTMHNHGLELELFPSGQPSSSTSRSSRAHLPSSFDFQAAAGQNEPWSQPDLKATQYLRDEWLISAGQKRPTDLVEDLIPSDEQARGAASAPPLKARLRAALNGIDMASSSSLTTAWAARAQTNTTKPATTKLSRSSLLDQLDAICSSPSGHFSSSPHDEASKSTPESPAARRPLQAVSHNVDKEKAAPLQQKKGDELSAIEMLEMSCSPPSQTGQQHITLIRDMPQELRDVYHRLAFGGKSSSSSSLTPPNPGTTARGTRGKTWQTTWQDDDQNSPAQSTAAAGSSNRTSSSRGRKSAASTTTASNGARATKARSSTASSSSAKSRFFAAKAARGGFKRWRGRGRGRGR